MFLSAKNIIDVTISNAAGQYNSIIVQSPVNEASYELLYRGFAAKTKEITERTCDEGLFKGLIVSKKGKELVIDNKYGVIRNGHEIWVKRPLESDKIVKALINEVGQYITADIDILLIASFETQSNEMIFDQYFGYLTNYEKKIIEFINLTYSAYLKRDNNIITHGPYNRYHKSLKKLLKFPLTAFLPDRIYINSLSELMILLEEKKSNFYIPPHWL